MASTRAGNVIGGGDWAQDRLVPDIVKGLLENRPTTIRYPNAVRPWQHVLVPLSGYLALAEHLWNYGRKFVGAWNFGPREEDTKPVWWIADYLIRKWGQNARWIKDQSQIAHEDTLFSDTPVVHHRAEVIHLDSPCLHLRSELLSNRKLVIPPHPRMNGRSRHQRCCSVRSILSLDRNSTLAHVTVKAEFILSSYSFPARSVSFSSLCDDLIHSGDGLSAATPR